MRILYLSQYFPPEMGAPAARVSELSSFWVESGAKVTVTTTFPNHPTGVIPPEYRGKKYQEEDWKGVRVLRSWIFVTPNKGFLKRVISFLSFMISATLVALFKSGSCQVVIATSPQIFCGLAGWIVSFVRRKPFVLEVRDLWPDSAIELGVLKNPLLIGLSRGLEKFLYRRATLIVPVSEAIQNRILDHGIPAAKTEVIPNGIDPRLFSPGQRLNRQRTEHGFEDRFLVSYIGTHGMAHGLENVLLAADLLRAEESIRFVFIGDGAEKENLLRFAAEKGLNNVTFLPPQPKADIPYWLSASDVALVSLLDLPVFETVLPSKMFEIMACGRPVALIGKGESQRLLSKAEAGVVIEPGDPEKLARTLLALKEDPALRERLGSNGREYVLRHFDRKRLAERYLARLEGLRKS